MRWSSILVLCGVAFAFALPARAAQQEKALPKKISLEGFSVDGTVQKPQAFYVLPRSGLNYRGLERPPSFLPKIQKALRKEPF